MKIPHVESLPVHTSVSPFLDADIAVVSIHVRIEKSTFDDDHRKCDRSPLVDR
jgi:hypothetical protein